MQKLWFRRKTYGWGWTPSTVEGGLVVVMFLVLLLANALRLEIDITTNPVVLKLFFIQTLLISVVFLGICYYKGEKPRFNWGDKH